MDDKDQEMVTTAIQFPKELHSRIKQAADQDERSFAYVIRKAAEEYLESHGFSVSPTPRETAAPAKKK